MLLKENVVKNRGGTSSDVQNGPELTGTARINRSRGIRRSIRKCLIEKTLSFLICKMGITLIYLSRAVRDTKWDFTYGLIVST